MKFSIPVKFHFDIKMFMSVAAIPNASNNGTMVKINMISKDGRIKKYPT